MLNRRDTIVLGASAAMAALTRGVGASAKTGDAARLETRLFNFRDDVPAEKIAGITGKIGALIKGSGPGVGMIGKNLSPTPFKTRFEWIYMIQTDALNPRAGRRFQELQAELGSFCRNEAVSALGGRLPAGFAAAPGVSVRHTVMFNFKPDATAEARDRNVAAIAEMGKLPMVQHYVVQRALSGTGPNGMEWQVIGDFASLADYQAYAEAPVHTAIRQDFTANTSRVAFLDVEV